MAESMIPTKEPLILRCLKAAAGVDWKAMAIVLAALAGFGGAIWNKVDAIVDRALAARTQQGVYEILVQRLDEMGQRLDALEAGPTLRNLRQAPAKVEVRVDSAAAKAATLPSFEAIQQQAVLGQIPMLINAVPVPE